tara:strand:- start:1741 stop:2118 length:378 start_codon:yes stop_codon:yes gene_type:complete
MFNITMSFLGPAMFLANRSEFKKRLIQEKEDESKSNKINSYHSINSYQNNSIYVSVYIYKIDSDICFVKTNQNEEMVIPRNKEKIYYISQQMTVIKDLSKLPYVKNRYLCFYNKIYHYAKEYETV